MATKKKSPARSSRKTSASRSSRRKPTARDTAFSSWRIENHRLIQPDGAAVTFRHTPNQSGVILPEYLVIHFTAGRSAESSIDWFLNPDAKASAHLVIGRDGTVTQMADFNRACFHAGQSQWAGRSGLNAFSIGIELDNAGKLSLTESGWKAWFGGNYPTEEVLVARHRNESDTAGWHLYSEVQLTVAAQISSAILRHYGLKDVIGHDDIAPHRKNDPGPAFPMEEFKGRVMGRSENEAEVYFTSELLNLRIEPNSAAPKIIPGGLPPGTWITPIGPRMGSWWLIKVLDTVDGNADLEGWVHSAYLRSDAPRMMTRDGGFSPPPASQPILAGIPFEQALPVGGQYRQIYDAADQGSQDPSNCNALLRFPNGTIFFSAKMAIDSDGSPRAPQIDPTGQIHTSLRYQSTGHSGASLNAERIPYLVLPLPASGGGNSLTQEFGIKLGDVGAIIYKGGLCGVVFADFGPHRKIGEASIRAHELLPAPSPWTNSAKLRVRNVSVDNDVLYFVFPGTAAIMNDLTPVNAEERIMTRAQELLNSLRFS